MWLNKESWNQNQLYVHIICNLSWKYNLTNLRNDMYTFKELIDIRDGIKECNGFTKAEISRFILNICTRWLDNDTKICMYMYVYIYIYIYITMFYMFYVCFFQCIFFLLTCTFIILYYMYYFVLIKILFYIIV